MAIVGLSILILTGCDKVVLYENVKSFVMEYRVYSEIEAVLDSNHEGVIVIEPTNSQIVNFRSKGESLELYNQLCEVNNDLDYNKDVSLVMDIITEWAHYPNISDILITSDKDFDASHPAGTSLNDCVTVELKNYYNYVVGGYMSSDQPSCYYNGLASEVHENNLKMLTHGLGSYSFVKQPDASGVHKLTFAYSTVEGDKLIAEIDFEFK